MNKKIEFLSLDRIREISRQNTKKDLNKKLNEMVGKIEEQAKLGLFNLHTVLVMENKKDEKIQRETQKYIDEQFQILRDKGFEVFYKLKCNVFYVRISWEKEKNISLN